jgi:hypothetical protein
MFHLDKEGFDVSTQRYESPLSESGSNGSQILPIHIYCSQAADGSQRSVKTGERVCYYNGSADVGKEVSRYVQDQTGDMAVAGVYLSTIVPVASPPLNLY